MAPIHTPIAIIGSGFAGVGAAIRLAAEGFGDYLIFERSAELGGVWRDNSYPGCACDVESHLYSFSFAPNPDWSRDFAPQAEILAYLRATAARHGVGPHVRFEHEVLAATWDDAAERWHVETSRGAYTADVVIAAVGGLSEPATPAIKGLASFAGKVFHTARWDHAHDLAGRDVAVIGTGASAIQVVPAIQPKVRSLTLFQRTPAWVLPRRDAPIPEGERARLRRSRLAQRLKRAAIFARRELYVLPMLHPRVARLAQRAALGHLARKVADPARRAALTPSYTLGCKRILLSNDYYPALSQPNTAIVTDGIAEILPDGLRTAAGAVHRFDTLILATGFRVQDYPFAAVIRGREGALLADTWRQSMTAHLGTTVAGYPNLFIMMGPNTGLGHSSVLLMIESQITHTINALRHLRAHRHDVVEPRPEAQAAFVADVDARLATTVWASGCQSWYLDAHGRNSTLWPGTTISFARRVERFRPEEYFTAARRGALANVATRRPRLKIAR
jgi:cation diffusion facilitator CzcD-associated flavoprotein CzcO